MTRRELGLRPDGQNATHGIASSTPSGRWQNSVNSSQVHSAVWCKEVSLRGLFAGAFFDVVDDAVGGEETEDGRLTLGTGLGLSALEADDFLGFWWGDGASDFFGEQFGVTIVGDHRWFECFGCTLLQTITSDRRVF